MIVASHLVSAAVIGQLWTTQVIGACAKVQRWQEAIEMLDILLTDSDTQPDGTLLVARRGFLVGQRPATGHVSLKVGHGLSLAYSAAASVGFAGLAHTLRCAFRRSSTHP